MCWISDSQDEASYRKAILTRKETQTVHSVFCVCTHACRGWMTILGVIFRNSRLLLKQSPPLAQSSQNRLNWLASEFQGSSKPHHPSWDYKWTSPYLLFLYGFWCQTQILVLARWVLHRQSQLLTPTPHLKSWAQEPVIGAHRYPCGLDCCLLTCSPGRWLNAQLFVVGDLRSLNPPVLKIVAITWEAVVRGKVKKGGKGPTIETICLIFEKLFLFEIPFIFARKDPLVVLLIRISQ